MNQQPPDLGGAPAEVAEARPPKQEQRPATTDITEVAPGVPAVSPVTWPGGAGGLEDTVKAPLLAETCVTRSRRRNVTWPVLDKVMPKLYAPPPMAAPLASVQLAPSVDHSNPDGVPLV